MITKIKIRGYRIYRDLVLEPHPTRNLIVGANEAGKSTLIEAITLALTGRINGRSAAEELNPYWFNTSWVNEFVARRRRGELVDLPEIRIELFLENRPELQQLCGAINTEVPTMACPGIALRIAPNPEYQPELDAWLQDASPLLPVEYYMVDWRSFADERLTARPKALAAAVIDSRTVRSATGVDAHLRQILSDALEPGERAAISLAYRKVKASMSSSALAGVNQRIGTLQGALHGKAVTLAMDQSARTSWEAAVVPHVDAVPFGMCGQGQQASIKIALAMSRHAGRTNIVTIEEPENHLSHTSLTTLLHRIDSLASSDQQLFVTTHSAFVLNRLGLDGLLLLGADTVRKMSNLPPDTVSYFQKLPGYDTLRLVLAHKIVLVEGPSDEIVFERFFRDTHGKRPMDCGIDVLSMRGLSLRRCLQLCAALDKPVAALRDNDGGDPAALRQDLAEWLVPGRRELFVGEVACGTTLEPQLLSHNDDARMRGVLGITEAADTLTWMTREKTEAALRIAEAKATLVPPDYIRRAVSFIHG